MDTHNKSNKVILVTNIPNPYRIPLFNEINYQLLNMSFNFKVVFGALGYPLRKWNLNMSQCHFDYIVLPSNKISLLGPEKIVFTYRRLVDIINKENPSVVITPAFSFATMKLWGLSLSKKTKYIIWSGAINDKHKRDSSFRRIQRKILIKRAAGFIAYGTKAKEYLVSLGADSSKIEIGINTVDTEYFKNETQKIRDFAAREGEKRCLLSVGNCVRRKRIDLLLQTVKILKNRRTDFTLKLIGDGPELTNLKSLARKLDVDEYVSFEGFKQKSEIPKYFAEADCFLFPTEFDIWGLVLVEAMSAGLPCISSIYAGATHDLIVDEVTGFAMDFNRIDTIAERIDLLLNSPDLARTISRNAGLFISHKLPLEKSAGGFIRAISNVLGP